MSNSDNRNTAPMHTLRVRCTKCGREGTVTSGENILESWVLEFCVCSTCGGYTEAVEIDGEPCYRPALGRDVAQPGSVLEWGSSSLADAKPAEESPSADDPDLALRAALRASGKRALAMAFGDGRAEHIDLARHWTWLALHAPTTFEFDEEWEVVAEFARAAASHAFRVLPLRGAQ